jgi:predicted acyltransferase
VLTGRWILNNFAATKKTVWMFVAGLVCLAIGSAIDATFMPINKSLWSTSYCIFMTGWALLIFSAFYWLIDAAQSTQLRKTAQRLFLPFTIYGMNALFIFALSSLIAKMLNFIKMSSPNGGLMPLKSWLYAPFKTLPLSMENQSLLFAILFNALMFLIAWAMWKKKWFVKV